MSINLHARGNLVSSEMSPKVQCNTFRQCCLEPVRTPLSGLSYNFGEEVIHKIWREAVLVPFQQFSASMVGLSAFR